MQEYNPSLKLNESSSFGYVILTTPSKIGVVSLFVNGKYGIKILPYEADTRQKLKILEDLHPTIWVEEYVVFCLILNDFVAKYRFVNDNSEIKLQILEQ